MARFDTGFVDQQKPTQSVTMKIRNWIRNKLGLGGGPESGLRECTIAFTNMVGYSEIAASIPVEDLSTYMNQYFEGQCKAIVESGGLIVQYIGDKVMAVWDRDDSAECATVAATNQLAALAAFNVWAKERSFPETTNRIGITTGTISISYDRNAGAVRALGDHANLASRLEALAREYGAKVLLDGNTNRRMNGAEWATRHADMVRVIGKEIPVKLFSFLGRRRDLDSSEENFLSQHQIAISQYQAAQFEAARAAFSSMLEVRPDDRLASLYIARCEAMLEHPEYKGWDGVMPYFHN